jgi:predicted alpha/beta superfamily hydrolase
MISIGDGNACAGRTKPIRGIGVVLHLFRRRIAILVASLFAAPGLRAQAEESAATTTRHVLPGPDAHPRTVDIVRPAGWRRGPQTRVLVLLDGISALPFASEFARLVQIECERPAPVIVAVSDGTPIGAEGNRRALDYTPTLSTVQWARGDGGGTAFLGFLTSSVVPLIDQEVGPVRERALYGHSYGGLFGAFTLLRAPTTFQRLMLGSPSTFYDRDVVLRGLRADSVQPLPRDSLPRLFLTAGTEERWAVDGNAALLAAIRARHGDAVRVDTMTLRGVGHVVGSPISLLYAIRWAYCRQLSVTGRRTASAATPTRHATLRAFGHAPGHGRSGRHPAGCRSATGARSPARSSSTPHPP